MDKIFYNGNIRTLDNAIPHCQAMAVKGGVILGLGSDEEMLSLATRDTEKIDLQGRLMLPGFTDSHMHLMHYADAKAALSLFHATSLEETLEICRSGVDSAKKKGGWVVGLGFNENNWEEKRLPSRADLDAVSTEVPVMVRRACFHMSIVNTKALELLGLLDERSDTTLHHMKFLPDGTPNGILEEDTQSLIQMCMGTPPLEDIKEMILAAAKEAAAQGLVQVHTDDFESFSGNQAELVIQAYRELAEEGRLPIRIYQQCLLRDKKTLDAFLSNGHRTGETHGLYKLGPLKLLGDGSLGANTAALRQPYHNAPHTDGILIYDGDTLQELVDTAHQGGMQIAIHCIGDRTLQQVLDCFDEAMKKAPRENPRHGIVHCQITDLSLLERMRHMNVIAYIQPIFVHTDLYITNSRIGDELAATSYNWRKMLDMGIHASGGSDCPVESFQVLPNICCAVTRTDLEGSPSWYPENCVTVDEAVRMFTVEGAYAAFEEAVRGTLTVGKLADLVVLDRDIYQIPADEIKDVRVCMTVVNGKTAYDGTPA